MADGGDQGAAPERTSFRATRATLALMVEDGDIDVGRGIRYEHDQGGFIVTVRVSQGGITLPPRPVTPEESSVLLVALQDQLQDPPPPGVDRGALQAAVCLLSEATGGSTGEY